MVDQRSMYEIHGVDKMLMLLCLQALFLSLVDSGKVLILSLFYFCFLFFYFIYLLIYFEHHLYLCKKKL